MGWGEGGNVQDKQCGGQGAVEKRGSEEAQEREGHETLSLRPMACKHRVQLLIEQGRGLNTGTEPARDAIYYFLLIKTLSECKELHAPIDFSLSLSLARARSLSL